MYPYPQPDCYTVFTLPCAATLGPESHWEVLNALAECKDESFRTRRWRIFGLGLGLPRSEVERIKKETGDYMDELQRILWAWLNGKGRPPKWEVLIEVLRAPAVGMASAAAMLERKYCSDATPTQGVYYNTPIRVEYYSGHH